MHETSRTDCYSWYSYFFASSCFASVGAATFGPLLIDSIAHTYSRSRLGMTAIPTCEIVNGSYFYAKDGTWVSPNSTGCMLCVVGFGEQVYFSDDRYEQAPTLYVIGNLRPSAFALVVVAFSVFAQAVCFLLLGAMADYSNLRKVLLILSAWCGSVVGILFLATPINSQGTGLWVLALLWIIANVFLGISSIFHISFMQYLTNDHPKVKAAAECAEQIKNRLMSIGTINGFFGSLLGNICTVIVLSLSGALKKGAPESDMQQGYLWAVVVAAVLWGVFSFGLLPLHVWPGKSLPEGTTSYVMTSYRSTADTLRQASKLPQTFRYLMLWFVFSDGVSTTGRIGLLFAKHDMCASVTNQFLVAITVPIAAAIGSWLFYLVHQKFSLTAMQTLRLTLAVYLLLPIWGIIGYIPSSPIGFRQIWELYFIGAWYGLILGANTSYSRTVFSDLIPPGEEAQFFSLYMTTGRASSWIGPFVVGMLTQTRMTGVMRVSFFYLFATTFFSLLLLGYIDVEKGKSEAHGWEVEPKKEKPISHEESVRLFLADFPPGFSSGGNPTKDAVGNHNLPKPKKEKPISHEESVRLFLADFPPGFSSGRNSTKDAVGNHNLGADAHYEIISPPLGRPRASSDIEMKPIQQKEKEMEAPLNIDQLEQGLEVPFNVTSEEFLLGERRRLSI